MKSHIILPAYYPKVIDQPIIFLAGPIQGADRWQDKAMKIIYDIDSGLYTASPRRPSWAPGEGDWMNNRTIEQQVEWESYFLKKASENGTILFWLANEHVHHCHRAYAQATRFELAEWKSKSEYDKNINLVLGIDDNFPGKNYITKRFTDDSPHISITSTLEETCQEAVRLARK